MTETKSPANTPQSDPSKPPETPASDVTTVQPPNQPEKSNQKYSFSKKWLIVEAVLLSIIILLSITFSLYKYFYKPRTLSTPQPTSTTSLTPSPFSDPNASWKTYTSPELGIIFRYPPNWNDPQETVLSTRYLTTFSDGQEIEGQETKLEITSGIYFDQVSQRNLTLKELINQTNYPEIAQTTQKELKLGNLTGTHFIYHKHGLGYFMSDLLLAENNNSSDILNITYRHSSEESNPDNPDPVILNQILSTLKFTNQETIDTSNWKTYTNQKEGYSLLYPPNWKILEAKEETDLLEPGSNYGFIITVMSNIPNPEKFLESASTNPNYTNSFNSIRIGNLNTLVQIPQGLPTHTQYELMAIDQNVIFNVVFLSNNQTRTNTVSQILSTFKVTNPLPTRIPTPTPLSGWTIYKSPKSNFQLKLPASWKILSDESFHLVISNLDFNPDLNNGTTPIFGQIIVTINLTAASLENYSTKKISYVSTEGVPVYKQGRYIDSSGSVGITTLYIQNDSQTSQFEKTITEILSANKFTD